MSRLIARLLFATGTIPLAACVSHADAEPSTRHPEPAATTRTPGAEDVDSTEFARTLVEKCARVKRDELVVVSGAPRDARLLEDVATEVRRVGAHPLVWIESDRMRRMSYVNVPEKFDGQTPAWRMRLAQNADVEIAVDGSEDESLLADVSPRRIAARERAAIPVTEKLMQRGVRQVYVGNDLRPTADRAKRYGMSDTALARIYRAALDVDYDELEATGKRIASAFAHSKKRAVRVTSENGTDFTFGIQDRRPYVSDGVVSEADQRRGGAALLTWLPAGEAFVGAAPGTAEGRIVVPRDTWDGIEYRDLVLTFHEGRLTSMTAESGGERLEAAFAAGGAGKDLFGGVDVGFNPALVAPAGSSLRTFAASGSVTISFGADTWLGGDNASDFSFTASLADATLSVDGLELVRGGSLVR